VVRYCQAQSGSGVPCQGVLATQFHWLCSKTTPNATRFSIIAIKYPVTRPPASTISPQHKKSSNSPDACRISLFIFSKERSLLFISQSPEMGKSFPNPVFFVSSAKFARDVELLGSLLVMYISKLDKRLGTSKVTSDQ